MAGPPFVTGMDVVVLWLAHSFFISPLLPPSSLILKDEGFESLCFGFVCFDVNDESQKRPGMVGG